MHLNFYNNTKDFLQRKAVANGVTNLNKYYKVTDTKMEWYRNFQGSEIARCFAQLAFHGQNATMISNIVKFEQKHDFLYEVTCNFEPNDFYNTYCSSGTFDEQVNRIVDALRYDQTTNPNGLVWDSSKSKEDNKDKIAKRFAKLLIKGADYLRQFATKQELIDDLMSHHTTYRRGGVVDENKNLIDYFMGKMEQGSGFSIALTCDFLKELDETFDFLAKPDVHIMDVLAVYLNKGDGYYYNGEARARECLRDFQAIVEDINQELPDDEKITVYQFDRMIWLICSGKFFLDDVNLSKQDYINQLP